ncbi:hypothetical protein TGUWTKB_4740 [Candidatus Tachikawaea gelatinosa]|uniref:Uncharacterized protein n=1 Tax=Candidatus Tachikawaea gelatinosa TaxID=1410383 RepID=A0A090AS62_9ENTR|nr:hypothetical protein TGUWTKB_4740 [Candidatus Tachikawaea gelatinosa]
MKFLYKKIYKNFSIVLISKFFEDIVYFKNTLKSNNFFI